MKSLPAIAAMGAVLVGGAVMAVWSLKDPGKPDAPERRADGSGGEEIELRYVPEGFPMGLSSGQGYALNLSSEPDPGFEELPPETGEIRTYDTFSIAGDAFRTVTESSSPPRIWLDANGNGDLTDDPGPFPAEGSVGVCPNVYTLQLPPRGGGEPFPYRLRIFPSNMGGTRFYAFCHMAGELPQGDEPVRLVLFDANANGDYSDDALGIDADRDGKIADRELLLPGDSLDVDGARVTFVSAPPDGRSARIR